MSKHLLSLCHPHHSLPISYVHPEPHRPHLSLVNTDLNIPIIDLKSIDKAQIVAQIGQACQTYGFFQVINHGIETELSVKMMEVGGEFFGLPDEEKLKLYSDDPLKKIRVSTSFNVKEEKVNNWRDYLRLHCYPLDKYMNAWPSQPPAFKDVVSKYCTEVRDLGFRLFGLISLSLGLEEEYIKNVLGEQEQHLCINYYPQCPEPNLTYGLPPHTDPNALTILLQDHQVSGLQFLKDDKWIAIKPQPDALFVNIGDQLQALSNSIYKSVWHRAVVNSEKDRISVASFLCPSNNAVISPAEKLTMKSSSPAIYRNFTYDEYYKKFWSKSLDQDHCLEHFRTHY